MYVSEEEKFLDELTEMSSEGDSVFNRDSIFAQLAFTLTKGSIVLKSEESKALLFLNLFSAVQTFVHIKFNKYLGMLIIRESLCMQNSQKRNS